MRIRLTTANDAAAIASIYAPYVLGTAVSFEAAAPDEAGMARRIAANGDLYPWFVADEAEGAVLGYASASQFRPRHAYRFTVETSVYLADGARGRGIGAALTRVLLETLESQGFTQAVAAITLPNQASVRMHEALGFGQAGIYEKVGFKFGLWHSVGLWQRGLAALSDQPEEPKPFAAVWKP